jgi:hypothetical protein
MDNTPVLMDDPTLVPVRSAARPFCKITRGIGRTEICVCPQPVWRQDEVGAAIHGMVNASQDAGGVRFVVA